MKTCFLIIYLFFLSITCVGQGKIDKIRNFNWISVDYIKQMENRLPCQCADSINYIYYISIASQAISDRITEEVGKIPDVIVHCIIQTEPWQYYIISTDSNKYVISVTNDNLNDNTYELTLNNDTLSLIDGNSNKKFVKSSFPFNDYDDNSGFDNIALLNQSLLLRGYPSIQKILKEEALSFDCNAWIGDLNIIYSHSRKKAKSWILEINEGYLYIRKAQKPQRDPHDPIITKVIKILKWDKENKNSIPIHEKTKVFDTVKWVSPPLGAAQP